MSRMKKQSSPKLTAKLASEIKGLWQQTSLNQAQIAAKLGALNQGRVSEVINGHRFNDVSAAEIRLETRND